MCFGEFDRPIIFYCKISESVLFIPFFLIQNKFIDYLKTESPLMKVYTKKTQPFLQAVRDLGILYINGELVHPGQEIK